MSNTQTRVIKIPSEADFMVALMKLEPTQLREVVSAAQILRDSHNIPSAVELQEMVNAGAAEQK